MTMPDPTPDPAVLSDARAREALARELPQQAFDRLRTSILSGSTGFHSDPLSWVVEAAIRAIVTATPPAIDAAVPAGYIRRNYKLGFESYSRDKLELSAGQVDAGWEQIPLYEAAAPKVASGTGAGLNVDRVRRLVDEVEAGRFDALEAVADKWIDSAGIIRMANAIASVFEKYAPQDVMDRFREKLADMMHLSFVEGAAQGVMQIKPAALATPTDATDGATDASEAAGLLREAANLAGRIEAAGGLVDEGANFERWKATARDLAPRLRAALTHPAPSGAWGEVQNKLHEALQTLYDHNATVDVAHRHILALFATTPGADLLEQAARVADNLASVAERGKQHPHPLPCDTNEAWRRVEDACRDIADAIRALSPARDGAGS